MKQKILNQLISTNKNLRFRFNLLFKIFYNFIINIKMKII